MLDRRSALRRIGLGAAAAATFGGEWGPAAVARVTAAEPSATPQLTVDVTARGSSSLLQLRGARKLVPTNECKARLRPAVSRVLKNVSIYRKMPEILCQTDPQTLQFFLDHPDVAVSLWRSMGVSAMTLTETAPGTYAADGGEGSVGRVEVALARKGEQVVYCTGRFVNPVAKKPIQADCVIHFRNRFERSQAGDVYSRHSATMFVSLPSAALEATARVISPVSNRIADRNFEEVSLFVRMMSSAMQTRPGWCEQVGRGMDGVSQAKIDAFLTCCAQVYASHSRATGRGIQTAGRDSGTVR